ncbi:MAG: AAA family ATPase, partial [Verrucomicrobiota bacterium]|nr:AAA family ATPase [Verrucomicrobiota bacterium]
KVNFKNTVIILTSNIGSSLIQDFFAQGGQEASSTEELDRAIQDEVKRFFRPEFLNRLDDTIIFHSLTEKDLEVIVDMQLKGLSQRLSSQKLSIQLSPMARKYLGRKGYDPQFGARPLKRAIQEEILDPLALRLLDGSIKPGALIRIDLKEEELTWDIDA